MDNGLKKLDIAQLAFWGTIALTLFLMGGVFVKKEIYPYQIIEDHLKASKALVNQFFQKRPDLLQKSRYAGDGLIQHNPNLAYGGLTLVQGVFLEGVELRLLNMEGDVLHTWPVDFFEIWPNPKHIIPTKNIPATHFNYNTHGMWALPDGSVVVNVAGKGTVKLSKCGQIQWTVERMTHHSITPTVDGGFWIPGRKDVREVSDDLILPKLSRDQLMASEGRYEDVLLLIDANGQIKEEISVLKALFEGGFERELYDVNLFTKLDPTHLNDIEVVTSALAEKIHGVEAGDLLVSLRQMHMLAILSRETGQIVWHKSGPWIRQHDPDITSEGIIEVYNNGSDKLSLNRPPGSSLIAIDASTETWRSIYPIRNGPGFYSEIMGTHQTLPNGNRLITETMAGRLFEIDKQGDIVWEYIKPYDDTHAALIESAIRYDKDYFDSQDWKCL